MQKDYAIIVIIELEEIKSLGIASIPNFMQLVYARTVTSITIIMYERIN